MEHQKKHNMRSGGYCICPKCETKVLHKSGIPCKDNTCPNCNAKMLRENSDHHKLLIAKKNKQ